MTKPKIDLTESELESIIVFGGGGKECGHDLNIYTKWGVEINDSELPRTIENLEGYRFFDELRKHIGYSPEITENRLCVSVDLPLKNFKHKCEAYKVIERYFPEIKSR